MRAAAHGARCNEWRAGVGVVSIGVVIVQGGDTPDAKEVGAHGVRVHDEHGLGGQEGVVQEEHEGDVAGGLIKLDDLDVVDELLEWG